MDRVLPPPSGSQGRGWPRVRAVLIALVESYFDGLTAIYRPYADPAAAAAVAEPAPDQTRTVG